MFGWFKKEKIHRFYKDSLTKEELSTILNVDVLYIQKDLMSEVFRYDTDFVKGNWISFKKLDELIT